MKTAMLATAIAAALGPLFAAESFAGSKPVVVKPIIVSCFRGPWHEVIIDRPTTRMIDSLVGAGYDLATATAIGERICRDQEAVGNVERLTDVTVETLNLAPLYRR